MFKIVTVFTRPASTHNFFYDQYADHIVVIQLKEKFQQSQGFLGKEFLKQEDHIIEIAMCFSSQKDFFNFVIANKELLDQRSELIRQWCITSNQTYNFYTVDN